METGTYMTFTFEPKAMQQLLNASPDYILMNVGYSLITDPENPEKKVAKLIINGESWRTDSKTPLLSVAGCPVPPCDPTKPPPPVSGLSS